MKLFRFAFIHLKKGLKDKKILGFSFLMPVIVITAIYFGFLGGAGDDKGGAIAYTDIAVNVADKGQLAEKMLKELKINGSIYKNQESNAIESLKKNDKKAVYTLPEDFTEKINKGIKPEVIAYKNIQGNSTSPFEGIVDDWINNKVKVATLINSGIIKSESEIPATTIKTATKGPEKPINKGQYLTLLLIINFMRFSANTISSELLALKRQHILSRAITTANKGYEIIGGIYLGAFLIQMLVYTSVYLIEKLVMGYSLNNFPVVLVGLALLSLVSISLGILVVRIFENESVVALVVNLVGIITTFLAMAGMNFLGSSGSGKSWIVANLSRFTPQYWVMNSIDTSALFPNCFILILMALVLFTAGNYKIRGFVNR
jgi:ABC-2 type transport system permease protein